MTPESTPETPKPFEAEHRDRFVMVATGTEAFAVLLEAWDAWRCDRRRPARLALIWIVPEWPNLETLGRGLLASTPERASLGRALLAAWPTPTPNLHQLGFEDRRVQWLLAPGSLGDWLAELTARVDAWWLGDAVTSTGVHADAKPSQHLRSTFKATCKAMARLASSGATLTAPALFSTPSGAARDALAASGFVIEPGSDAVNPAHTVARYAPREELRRGNSRVGRGGAGARAGSRAVIVGAGLAGCASAWALAEQGLDCTVLERRGDLALGASGNPAGLFHGVVHGHDGHHARFNRAAALQAYSAARVALDRHGVVGNTKGLLRLETTLAPGAMRALLDRLHLPAAYVQALDAAEASARAGIGLQSPAWFYPGGGWVQPAGLARSYLERAGARATLRTGAQVERLERGQSGWRLFDASDRLVDEAPVVVLANAGDAMRLLGGTDWPIEAVRGQLSFIDASALGAPLPRLPLAGAGYLIPAAGGLAVFGATSQPGDGDTSVRSTDHIDNLRQLGRLLGCEVDISPTQLEGRTGWRWVSSDRLPVIGAVPDMAAVERQTAARDHRPFDQPRNIPRRPGLFVYTALGSRGITWSALGARVLAALATGAPVPLENSLRDAVDPARFVARAFRRPGPAPR